MGSDNEPCQTQHQHQRPRLRLCFPGHIQKLNESRLVRSRSSQRTRLKEMVEYC